MRRLGQLAKRDASADGWLAAALAAAIGSYALGMLTFDAFAFTQVTFLAFVLIGISGVAVHLRTRAFRASYRRLVSPGRQRAFSYWTSSLLRWRRIGPNGPLSSQALKTSGRQAGRSTSVRSGGLDSRL